MTFKRFSLLALLAALFAAPPASADMAFDQFTAYLMVNGPESPQPFYESVAELSQTEVVVTVNDDWLAEDSRSEGEATLAVGNFWGAFAMQRGVAANDASVRILKTDGSEYATVDGTGRILSGPYAQ